MVKKLFITSLMVVAMIVTNTPTAHMETIFKVNSVTVDKIDALGKPAEDVRSFGITFSSPAKDIVLEIYKNNPDEYFFSKDFTSTINSVTTLYVSPGDWTKKLEPNTTYRYAVTANAATTVSGSTSDFYRGEFTTSNFAPPKPSTPQSLRATFTGNYINNTQPEMKIEWTMTSVPDYFGVYWISSERQTVDTWFRVDGKSNEYIGAFDSGKDKIKVIAYKNYGDPNNGADDIASDPVELEFIAPVKSATPTTVSTNLSTENISGPSTQQVQYEETKLQQRIQQLGYKVSVAEQGVVDFEKRLVTMVNNSLINKVKGRILLQVEEKGEAWYVDPQTYKKYYLKDGTSAYTALGAFGLGIRNSDLSKIPVGVESRFQTHDTDGDGLDDKLEVALGTDPLKVDTDGDGYTDGSEVKTGNNPLGAGKQPVDLAFSSGRKGMILLQVENGGQAWYVNPNDGKRYYMADGELAYQIMRFLSLGITNANLRQIPVGELR